MSIGVPKGVMLSQRNLFNSLKSFALSIDVLCTDRDTYIAFLPLAHVLEMLCEMLMVIHGVRQDCSFIGRSVNSNLRFIRYILV